MTTICNFPLPSLWPDQKFSTLSGTVAAAQFKTRVKKNITYLRTKWPKSIPCSVWPKRLKALTLWAPHTYIAHIKEYARETNWLILQRPPSNPRQTYPFTLLINAGEVFSEKWSKYALFRKRSTWGRKRKNKKCYRREVLSANPAGWNQVNQTKIEAILLSAVRDSKWSVISVFWVFSKVN